MHGRRVAMSDNSRLVSAHLTRANGTITMQIHAILADCQQRSQHAQHQYDLVAEHALKTKQMWLDFDDLYKMLMKWIDTARAKSVATQAQRHVRFLGFSV